MVKMVNQKRVLILGGTGEAAILATQAAQISDVEVITSLAGRTRQPIVPSENTRIGGFGGVAGLTNYLQTQRIDLLVDATHPFAAQISWNAFEAAIGLGIPHLLLLRPAWQKTVDDCWIEVPSHTAAAAILPELAQRIFLTIGRQELSAFTNLPRLWFLMRMIDPPATDAPIPAGEVILARGPFDFEHERSLLQRYKIGVIVSKNSGGDATYAKILAARALQMPVVIIQRPPVPKSDQVATIAAALGWIVGQVG